jgi:tRNA(adenine34) deaminase
MTQGPMTLSRNSETEKWIELLNHVNNRKLFEIERGLIQKRINWFYANPALIKELKGNDLERAYRLLLLKIGIDEKEAPIVERSEKRIVFRSENYCPALEACRFLGLDTRTICKSVFEKPTDLLIKHLNPNLNFIRNYDRIRPYTDFCEEMITLE